MTSVRLGLIGAGRWGRNYIKTLAGISGSALACVVSKNPETKGLVPTGCAVLSDIKDLPGKAELDGVIIATPPASHAALASDMLAKGLAVLVEKPLCLDVGEARGLLAKAEKSGGLALVEHTYLFHPSYRELKARAKRLGAPRRLSLRGGNWGPFVAPGVPLWEYGAHDVSLCLDFMGGKPAAVRARLLESRRVPEGPGELFCVDLEFAVGTKASIVLGNLMPERERLFEAEFAGETLAFDDTLPFAGERPLTAAVKAFVRSIQEGSRDLSSLKLGVDVVETLAAAQASLEKSKITP